MNVLNEPKESNMHRMFFLVIMYTGPDTTDWWDKAMMMMIMMMVYTGGFFGINQIHLDNFKLKWSQFEQVQIIQK